MLSLISVIGIGFCLHFLKYSSIFRIGLFVCFSTLIFSLSFEKCISSKILGSKLFVYGGLISYSLYMNHYLIDFIYYPLFCSFTSCKSNGKVFCWRFNALIYFVLSGIFYHFIEEPSYRFLRKIKIRSLFS